MSRRKQYELPHHDVNITPNNIKYGQLKKQATNPCLIGKIYLKNNISNTIIYCSEGIFHLLPIFYKFKILLYESYMVWFYALELGLKVIAINKPYGSFDYIDLIQGSIHFRINSVLKIWVAWLYMYWIKVSEIFSSECTNKFLLIGISCEICNFIHL